jgi:predicted DNA-binding antitoxin AbrB/MazE fold protein
MSMTIRAVYQGGMLRPQQPLPLAEGQTVEVTIATVGPAGPAQPALRPPTPEEEDYARRLKAAKSLEEMHAIMETAPASSDDPYDIVALINESRRLTGFRMPDPHPAGEKPQ